MDCMLAASPPSVGMECGTTCHNSRSCTFMAGRRPACPTGSLNASRRNITASAYSTSHQSIRFMPDRSKSVAARPESRHQNARCWKCSARWERAKRYRKRVNSRRVPTACAPTCCVICCSAALACGTALDCEHTMDDAIAGAPAQYVPRLKRLTSVLDVYNILYKVK
jgi:hypothetical protein